MATNAPNIPTPPDLPILLNRLREEFKQFKDAAHMTMSMFFMRPRSFQPNNLCYQTVVLVNEAAHWLAFLNNNTDETLGREAVDRGTQTLDQCEDLLYAVRCQINESEGLPPPRRMWRAGR